MKRFVLATLTVLTTAITFGQTALGVKAGLNLSNTKGFDSEAKPILAEHLGAFANINVGKRVFLRPELLYTMKGYKFPAWGMYDEGTLNCKYMAMPVLLGIRPMERMSFLLGAEVGYLLNAKFHFTDSTGSDLRQFNKMDVALNAGAAYWIRKRFSAEVRYSNGFKGLVNVTYADQSGSHTRKIGAYRVFQLSLNYQLTK